MEGMEGKEDAKKGNGRRNEGKYFPPK